VARVRPRRPLPSGGRTGAAGPDAARGGLGHPLAWIDDTLPTEAHAWATERRAPTLLISIDPAEGLTRPVIEQSLHWADSQRQDDQLQT
jgi:hypothetical protein